jgi:hypothetical protein
MKINPKVRELEDVTHGHERYKDQSALYKSFASFPPTLKGLFWGLTALNQ